MDERGQLRDDQTIPPLPYATRCETDGLLQAYRLVGWYYLLTAAVATISAVTYTIVLKQTAMGAWPAVAVSMLTNWGPEALLAIGAVGMIRGRVWGAWTLIAISAMRMLLIGIIVAMQLPAIGRSGSPGSWYALNSVVSSVLHCCLGMFLPWVFWRLCRRRGVWTQA
jgi:hypothetical protein